MSSFFCQVEESWFLSISDRKLAIGSFQYFPFSPPPPPTSFFFSIFYSLYPGKFCLRNIVCSAISGLSTRVWSNYTPVRNWTFFASKPFFFISKLDWVGIMHSIYLKLYKKFFLSLVKVCVCGCLSLSAVLLDFYHLTTTLFFLFLINWTTGFQDISS